MAQPAKQILEVPDGEVRGKVAVFFGALKNRSSAHDVVSGFAASGNQGGAARVACRPLGQAAVVND